MMQSTGTILPCQPLTVSYFHVENSIIANGIRADIRHFAWECSCDARFEPNSHYLDYSLGPRARGARLLPDGKRHAPPFGEVSYLPKGSQFEARCEPSEYRIFCLTFESLTADQLFQNEVMPSSLPPCFDVKAPWVRQGLARLAQEVRNPGFAPDIMVETIALSLVIDLSRHLQIAHKCDDTADPRMAGWRLRRLQERIEAGLAGPLSIVDLAEECGVSSRHLMRTFKNTVGKTLGSYIADARIAQAKRELVQDGALIKVVAGNCGFQSVAAFSAAFRKATGLSPRGFRHEMLRG
ncbi:helix-turn-helix domain-containing protein [Sphingobium sp. SA916]|uniref:helix-turn-helix domain-containing protein n=1 Tax=Sphingobium sp. SA916 TaxID=1851207 RepID=UPI000C9F1939|nr:AraC family transcriptional regulator [Sphingobium sp. SA916]